MLHQLPEPIVHQLLIKHTGYWKCAEVSRTCKTLRTFSHESLQMLWVARKIRRFWRNCVCAGLGRSKLFADYTLRYLAAEHPMEFQEWTEFIRERTTIATARRFFTRLCFMAQRTWRFNPRTVLAGYTCMIYPAEVFKRLGPLELRVVDSAREMIGWLHAAGEADTDVRQQAIQCTQAIDAFIDEFHAMKFEKNLLIEI